VLFEGDLLHSVEESKISTDLKLWRISYVLKLIINPRSEKQNVKKAFSELFHARSLQVNEIDLGVDSRV
jgi:ribosomal protein L23